MEEEGRRERKRRELKETRGENSNTEDDGGDEGENTAGEG